MKRTSSLAFFVSTFLLAGAAAAQSGPTPPPVPPPPTTTAPSTEPTVKPVEPPAVVAPPPPVAKPTPPPAVVAPALANEDPPSEPKETPKPDPREGVSANGLPFAMRGGVTLGVSALRLGTTTPVPTTLDFAAHIPVAPHTFVDAKLPLATATLGNPTLGVHHVLDLADRVWLSLGGEFGLPLINGTRGYDTFRAARVFWDAQDFATSTMPFGLRAALEAHFSLVELRVQAEPVWGIATKSALTHYFAFQHAVEAQVGHAFGAGVRYQGVVLGTDTFRTDDRYQGAVELFFRAVHGPLFARVGVVLPLDTPLSGSTADVQYWGVRAQTGFQFD